MEPSDATKRMAKTLGCDFVPHDRLKPAMPDTPTVTPLVDEQACGICGQSIAACNKQANARLDAKEAGLRPVEADDAGLIESLRTRAKWTDEFDPVMCDLLDEAADALASLSAAKVEAEKEVERLLEKLRIKIVPGDKVVLEDEAALKGRTAQGDGE